jgi:hypothetical protein
MVWGKAIDMPIGSKWGRLTIVSRAEKPPGTTASVAYWLCKCECGNLKLAEGGNLRSGSRKSCGCTRNAINRIMSKRGGKARWLKIAPGQTFGYLTAIERVASVKGHQMWSCVCQCGNTQSYKARDIYHGQVKSCGCLKASVGINKARPDLRTNLKGLRIGYLEVLEDVGSKKGARLWKCKCHVCGGFKDYASGPLIAARVKSCGCARTIGNKARKELENA